MAVGTTRDPPTPMCHQQTMYAFFSMQKASQQCIASSVHPEVQIYVCVHSDFVDSVCSPLCGKLISLGLLVVTVVDVCITN